jgi:exosortase
MAGGVMSDTSRSLPSTTIPHLAGDSIALWQWGVFVALLAWIYHGILWRLVEQWWGDPDFSHGFFVPLFCGFVVWQNRKRLAEIVYVPSWSGLVVIAGSLITLIVGVLGAELFLSRSSLILLLAGLIVLFLGWTSFRAVHFPWACLFLMVPIPKIIYNQITLPLQFLASRLAGGMLGLSGVPVLREGNIIHLPAMDLEVVEACSGIRSLLSLTALAVIYGYFLERRTGVRIVLVLAAVPIAVAANGLRIMGTGLMAHYWSPDKAEGFFHMFAGWVIFLLSFGMLFLLHGMIRWVGNRRAAKGA